MALLLKLKHCSKRKHPNKYVIIITPFINKSISGSISGLIILVEPVPNGMLKYVRKYSLISIKMVELLKKRWCKLTVNTALCSWLIDLLEAHALSVSSLMLVVTNAINVKNYSTHP